MYGITIMQIKHTKILSFSIILTLNIFRTSYGHSKGHHAIYYRKGNILKILSLKV